MLRLLLFGLFLCFTSLCHAAPDDDNGEVRFYVRAAFTGEITSSHESATGGRDEDNHTEGRLQDRVTVVFEGTTTWRIMNWAPGLSTHNCRVSIDGGGSTTETSRGRTPTNKHNDVPYVHTKLGRWTYTVPAAVAGDYPVFSPAGSVGVVPVGMWFGNISAYPNFSSVHPEGEWTERYWNPDSSRTDTQAINAENAMTSYARAHFAANDAYQNTLGPEGGGRNTLTGTWDPAKKGFFASGHITNRGGYPPSILGSRTPDANGFYSYSTSTTTWSADVLWTISYTLNPPPVECIIEPDPEYAKWIPAGGASEEVVGNMLGVTAKLQVKGQPNKNPVQRASFRFELVGVSQEPGIALNFPRQNAKTTPDLKFVEGGNATPKEDGRVAESPGKLLNASAQIGCYDYGAFGKLRVVATLDDGSVVYGHLQGQPGKEELSIPLDDDQNHVADGWRPDETKGLLASADDEANPPLGDVNGDGLSLYEEYRGLIHQGSIVRLNPKQKDLVIVNEMGAQAGPGLMLFESASGIHVVELAQGELGTERIVNLNSTTGYHAPQRGLRLVSEALAEGIIGMSYPDAIKQSPADCVRTAINSNLSFLPAGDRAALLAAGIAHEIGHSLGAQHHGDSGPGTTYENLTINDANAQIFDTSGHPVTERPYTLQGLIESKMSGGEGSGAQECVMRNSSYFQWIKRVDNMGAAAYYAVPPTAPGNTFCQTPGGTGINADGNEPVSYFGKAAAGRGECTKHLRVKDN